MSKAFKEIVCPLMSERGYMYFGTDHRRNFTMWQLVSVPAGTPGLVAEVSFVEQTPWVKLWARVGPLTITTGQFLLDNPRFADLEHAVLEAGRLLTERLEE